MERPTVDPKRAFRVYLIGSLIVWVAIIAATAVILSGTDYLAPMLAILGGGGFWFIIVVPTLFRSG